MARRAYRMALVTSSDVTRGRVRVEVSAECSAYEGAGMTVAERVNMEVDPELDELHVPAVPTWRAPTSQQPGDTTRPVGRCGLNHDA
jgi:hypothetical protein